MYVGIDVSKSWLDVALRPGNDAFRVENSAVGIESLLARLRSFNLTLVVVESTGGYERDLAAAIGAHELPLAVVNPRHVRDFAKALGKLAKTDKIDAAVIAHFAEAVAPQTHQPKSEDVLELQELVSRRKQVVQMLTAEKTRLYQARCKTVRDDVQETIRFLKKRLKSTDDDIQVRLKRSDFQAAHSVREAFHGRSHCRYAEALSHPQRHPENQNVVEIASPTASPLDN
jgi:transposase